MNQTPHRQAVVVGLFVSVGLAIFTGGVLTIGGLTDAFASTVHVSAVFDDVGGLQKGDNVWYSGVPIGTVSGVRFEDGSRVAVDLAIEEDASAFIRSDALAKISSDGLIGNTIVVLYEGSTSAPSIEDGDVLHVGDALSTDDMMAMLQENNANLLAVTQDLKALTAGIAAGEGTVGRLLTDESLYDDLRGTVATLQGAASNAEAMTASMNSFAQKVNAPGSLPHQLVTDRETYASLTSTVAQLESAANGASGIVASLEQETRNPDSPLGTLLYDEEAGADLKQTLDHLNSGSAQLSDSLDALEHNWLLRGSFKKLERARAKEAEARSEAEAQRAEARQEAEARRDDEAQSEDEPRS